MVASLTRVTERRAELEGHPRQADRYISLVEGRRSRQREGVIEAPGEDLILIVYEVAEGIRLSISLGRYR
jgi:hypothetical protein